MRRRFVIGIDDLNAEQERIFRQYIQTKGDWWHWIGDLWLLTTMDEGISTKEIRDFILRTKPGVRTVVFEFPEDINWSASSSTNAEGNKLADWLRQKWGKGDDDDD